MPRPRHPSRPHLLYLLLNPLGELFRWLESRCDDAAKRLIRCPGCGRSCYYGEACQPPRRETAAA